MIGDKFIIEGLFVGLKEGTYRIKIEQAYNPPNKFAVAKIIGGKTGSISFSTQELEEKLGRRYF